MVFSLQSTLASDRWSGALGDQLAGGDPFAMDHIQSSADDDGYAGQGERVREIGDTR